eukprot:SAG31_NODE_1287_length_8999_cov_3.844382_8_plen_112_part_00
MYFTSGPFSKNAGPTRQFVMCTCLYFTEGARDQNGSVVWYRSSPSHEEHLFCIVLCDQWWRYWFIQISLPLQIIYLHLTAPLGEMGVCVANACLRDQSLPRARRDASSVAT